MATSIEVIPAGVPITVVSGNSIEFDATITVSGSVVDLTVPGNVISLVVESTTTEDNVLTISSAGGSPQITLSALGVASVTITAAQTAEIAVGTHFYALKWVRPSGAVRTITSGPFTVLKSRS
jgi:hypothetical protein